MRCTSLSAILLAAATAASAQTVEEAARSNLALATRLCVQAMLEGTAPRTLFEPAGFTYRAIDRGTNDYGIALGLDHYFEAPGDTAKAEVGNPDGHPGICYVMTTRLPQAEVDPLVSGTLFQTPPPAQVEQRSGSEWTVRRAGDLPLLVNSRTIGTNHRYEAPGTVSVSMGYPG